MRKTSETKKPALSTRFLVEGDPELVAMTNELARLHGAAIVLQDENGRQIPVRINTATGRLESYRGTWQAVGEHGTSSADSQTTVIVNNSAQIVGGPVLMDDTVTLSGLTSERLVASDTAKRLVSSDLVDWIAGTSGHISVTDDGDGTVTLDVPLGDYLKLDQTTPQSVINGAPQFAAGLQVNESSGVVFKGTTYGVTLNTTTGTSNKTLVLPNVTATIAYSASGTHADIDSLIDQPLLSTSTPQFAKISTNDGSFEVANTSVTALGMQMYGSTDTKDRFAIRIDGLMYWGNGTDATDTNLYRSAANTLKTDDSLVVGASLSVGTSLSIGTDIVLPTVTGTKIGTATNQLLGFYGVTPVNQPDTISDPSGGTTVDSEARTAINALIDRLQELGLIA